MRYLILFLILISAVNAQTLYYGQVLYKDKPMTGFDVTAHWTDVDNSYQTFTVKTLDKEQAYERNSITNTGYYFFEKGIIEAKKGTSIVFTFGDYPYSIIILPSSENAYRVNTISFDYGSFAAVESSNVTNPINETQDNEKDYLQNLINQNISNDSIEDKTISVLDESYKDIEEYKKDSKEEEIDVPVVMEETSKKSIKDYSDMLFTLLIISSGIALIAIVFFLAKHGISYLSQTFSLITPESMIKRILKMKVRDILGTLDYVSSDATLNETLDYLVDFDIVYIKDENYKGYIRREDLFLLKEIDKKISINNHHSDKLTIEPEKNILEAFNLMKSSRSNWLCVSQNNEIKGEVTMLAIQKAVNISKQNLGTIPSLRDNLDKNIVTIKKGEKIESAIKLMILKNTKIVNIMEDEKIIGIFTLHEYINGIKKYRSEVKSQSVESLMLSNFPKVDAESDILDANSFLIEKGMRQIPVIVHGEIIGILSDEKILSAIFNYFANG